MVPPRPARPDLREKKALAIIEASAEVLTERGLNEMRMADVAARAGIGKATIYEYFGTKDELVVALFEWYAQAMLEGSAQATPASETATGELRSFVEASLSEMEQVLELYPISLEFLGALHVPSLKDRLQSMFRETFRQLRGAIGAIIQRGIDQGEFRPDVDPESVASCLAGALDSQIFQSYFERDLEVQRFAEHFVEILIRGMALDINPNQE